MDRVPGCTLAIESFHGREKGITPFASTGWVSGQIAIVVARSYSRMIHIDWLPRPLREGEPDWDPESVIRLEG